MVNDKLDIISNLNLNIDTKCAYLEKISLSKKVISY